MPLSFFIGSGRTGRIAIFHNNSGHLVPLEIEALRRPGTRGRTNLLGSQYGTTRSLLIGSANYEDGLTNGHAARQFSFSAHSMDDSLPGFPDSTGPFVLADFNGDGYPDLFLGARASAARYPEPVSSKFFRNENGRFVYDAALSAAFTNAGLVSAAIASDLNGDGTPELLLACENGPIRIFSFQNGSFREVTSNWGLDRWLGPWTALRPEISIMTD